MIPTNRISAKSVQSTRTSLQHLNRPSTTTNRSIATNAEKSNSAELSKCLTVDYQLPASALEMKLPSSASDEDRSRWSDWMGQTLAEALVGVSAATSRATVRTSAVRSAKVIKGAIRAEELDLVLKIEAVHLKEEAKAKGTVRIVLKTENSQDQFCLSDVAWEAQAPGLQALSEKVMDDLTKAAETPLESALATHFNDLLWATEQRSIDETIDDEEDLPPTFRVAAI